MKTWNWDRVLKARTVENVVAQLVFCAVFFTGYIAYDMVQQRKFDKLLDTVRETPNHK